MPQTDVEAVLLQEWTGARNSTSIRVLKVIHGYGSSGKGGSTRDVVRNWASRMASRFRAIVPGEEYSLFQPAAQAMRREVGRLDDAELDAGNRGITYLWIR